jgi:hypothetical protein
MQADDKPYRLPPAKIVADTCAVSCWRDDIDDESRLLLEMAADTIRQLMARCVVLAQHLERAECGK